MHLFESIIDANHRAVAGDANAGLHPDEFAESLPVIALTCIDPRLNAFFPNALALPAEQFIWLRNAGNIVTGTLTSTMRSLALACAVKGGREIAIIGHTDCQIVMTPTMVLLEKLKELGVDRAKLPDNINDFFCTFSSERQNVIKACDFVRHSPLIGPKIPVHGLMIDIENGKLDWIVNGYETLDSVTKPAISGLGDIGHFKDFDMGEMKFPEMKIGEASVKTGVSTNIPAASSPIETLPSETVGRPVEATPEQIASYAEKYWPNTPPKIPVPPPIRPRLRVKR